MKEKNNQKVNYGFELEGLRLSPEVTKLIICIFVALYLGSSGVLPIKQMLQFVQVLQLNKP